MKKKFVTLLTSEPFDTAPFDQMWPSDAISFNYCINNSVLGAVSKFRQAIWSLK